MREGRDVTSEHPIPGFLDLQLARFFLLKTCFLIQNAHFNQEKDGTHQNTLLCILDGWVFTLFAWVFYDHFSGTRAEDFGFKTIQNAQSGKMPRVGANTLI